MLLARIASNSSHSCNTGRSGPSAVGELESPAALRAAADADVIASLHPLAESPAPPLESVARLEQPPRAPVVTVYTKADLVSASTNLHQPPPSSTPVVVSAVTRAGLDTLLDT